MMRLIDAKVPLIILQEFSFHAVPFIHSMGNEISLFLSLSLSRFNDDDGKKCFDKSDN